MEWICFFAGYAIGGFVIAVLCHLYYQGKHEEDILQSYRRGYQAASDIERKIILDMIEQLKDRSSTCDPADDELSEGSDD